MAERGSTRVLRCPAMVAPTLALAVALACGDGAAVILLDSGRTLGAGDSRCVVAGDVDGDGDSDILVANSDTSSVLWINDGTGRLTAAPSEFPSATCALLGDLDGDGDADAVFTGDHTTFWFNVENGDLRRREGVLDTPGAVSAALGDLDGDDDLDLVVATWGHPHGLPNLICLNDGAGRFQFSPHIPGSAVSASVALGDVDGDGDLDIVVANQADAGHDPIPDELWLNDGTGAFTDSGLRLGRSTTYVVRLADLDGDGDLDAMAANSSHAGKSDPGNTVWLNDGSGTLVDSGQRLGNAYSLVLSLGDLDGDGDVDVYVGNYDTNDEVWLNDGSGRFPEVVRLPGVQNGHDVALADLDGDGDLDAVVVNNTWQGADGTNRVLVNVHRRE